MASNLAVRLLTAAVAAPLLMVILFQGSATAWLVVVLLAAAGGAYELLGMTHREDRIGRCVGALLAVMMLSGVYFSAHDPRRLLTLLLLGPVLGLLLTLWRLGELATAALRAMTLIAGPLYIGGLLAALALLRKDQGPFWVLLALKFSWLADTGGYAFGRLLGRHSGKLSPRVSPNKTRIGFAGSLVGALLGAVIAHLFYLPGVPLWELVALAAVAGSLGQLGDLAESMLKRSTGVKDSGSVIPGHGGVLDRIDALLIVSPIVYLYTLWRLPNL